VVLSVRSQRVIRLGSQAPDLGDDGVPGLAVGRQALVTVVGPLGDGPAVDPQQELAVVLRQLGADVSLKGFEFARWQWRLSVPQERDELIDGHALFLPPNEVEL
jgi:hypothetical protein